MAVSGSHSAMIFLIIVTALLFGYFLGISRVPAHVSDFIVGLEVPRFVILLGILTMYVVAGSFIDMLAFAFLTLPIIFPTILALGYDPLWFSIITVHILNEIGVKKIIAKALSEEHEKILRLVGAHEIVSPEKDVAQKLGNQINAPNLIDYIPLQSGFVIQEIAAPDGFIGKSLAEIALRKKYKVTVLAIKSIIPDVNIINPGGDVLIKESDILFVFGDEKDIETLHRKTKIE